MNQLKRIAGAGFGLFVILCVVILSVAACSNPAGDNGVVFTAHTNNSTANDVATLGLVGTSVSSSDTGVITVTITDGKIVITSVAAGSATITVSASGFTPAAIPVTVGADGAITIGAITKGVAFAPQADNSTANDAATLGLVGTSVSSSDTGVATVVIEGGKIVITSVAAGSATITVSAIGYVPAAIQVTVGAGGAISIGPITMGSPFTPGTNNTTANDVATLGLVGTDVNLSAPGVATATITDGKIVITSVAVGTATITVSAGAYFATIAVTVTGSGDGGISVVITKGVIPVTGITDVPGSERAGVALTLSGTVSPANATNYTIVWSVKNAGTTGASLISDSTLSTNWPGTVVVTATITDGLAAGTDYTQDFNIVVDFATPAQYRDMVLATPDATNPVTITGNAAYYYAITPDYMQGVFIEGRTVTLSPFKIAKYETTYELWYEVYQWATSHGYSFANAGRQGGDSGYGSVGTNKHPVTTIWWRDAIVWCNAYSEMSGKGPVYKYSGTVIRDSRNANATACDGAVMDPDANGYRLPTDAEWEYAARGGGTPSLTSPFTDKWAGTNTESELINYAWYSVNSGSVTHPVGERSANTLGLYDMTGNVWEWCWDWYESITASTPDTGPASGTSRDARGGCWDSDKSSGNSMRSGYNPNQKLSALGFRVVCP